MEEEIPSSFYLIQMIPKYSLKEKLYVSNTPNLYIIWIFVFFVS